MIGLNDWKSLVRVWEHSLLRNQGYCPVVPDVDRRQYGDLDYGSGNTAIGLCTLYWCGLLQGTAHTSLGPEPPVSLTLESGVIRIRKGSVPPYRIGKIVCPVWARADLVS